MVPWASTTLLCLRLGQGHTTIQEPGLNQVLFPSQGHFRGPAGPLLVEQKSWEWHCDLILRKCGLPTFFLTAWHLGILLKHLLEVASGKQAVDPLG